MDNHYQTLGVAENASQEEIKRAYRRLASQHHPDKGGDTSTFQRIQAAYDNIGDENKRAQYDNERNNPGGFRFTVNGQDMSGMPPGMDEIFRNFNFNFNPGHGGGDPFAAFRQPRKNKDIRVEVPISLASTLEQQSKTVSVQTTNGQRQTVEVQIPRGVHSGSTIKYSGLGDNFFESLPRGDLYVVLVVEPQSEYIVDGLDLIKPVDINCLHAIIGTTITIRGIDGKEFEVTIPAGTQPNTRLRIYQQGLYAINQNHRGNLLLVINITVPINLNPEQLKTIQSLITT
jgi:DnaJ-class molecular chaperone